MQRKEDTVKQLTDGVEAILESWGIEIIYGEASFVEPHVIAVTDEQGSTTKINGENFIVATGSRTSLPPIEGLRSGRLDQR